MWERRSTHPLLDLGLLKIREFGSAVVALVIAVTAFSSLALLLSLFFQLELGLSPLEAGLRLVPLDLTAVLMAPLSGKLSDRFGQTGFLVGGLTLTSITTYLFSTVDPSTPYVYSLVYMVLLGIGVSVFLAPNASLCMAAVPALRRGVAASVRSTFWNIGFTVSLNLVLWIMTFRVPFGVITTLISSVTPIGNLLVDRAVFMDGLKTAYLWLAALNAAALIPTLAGAYLKQKLRPN
jgi:MFS family permease